MGFMKGLLFKLGVAAVALAIGFAAFKMWPSSQPRPYCEVARHAESYHNAFIRVRAQLIFGSDGMYVFEDCDPVEALASMVEFEGGSDFSGVNYVDEVIVAPVLAPVKRVDAIIEGRFNAEASTGCWRPKFHIAATKIEFTSAVTDYKPQADGETPLRTKH